MKPSGEKIMGWGEFPMKGSEIGIVSLALFLISFPIALVPLVMVVGDQIRGHEGNGMNAGLLFCGGSLLNLCGAVFGVVGLIQRERKSFAAWGLILNILLPVIGFSTACIANAFRS
jgi:hypothetical protein